MEQQTMNEQLALMQQAINLGIKGMEQGHGGPFGCVVVKNGEVIGKGYNSVLKDNDPTAHAEVNAIRNACSNLQSFQLTDCDIYTSCEPCPMCLGAIYWARPRKIYFANSRKDAAAIGFDDSAIYEEMAVDLNNRKIPIQQIILPDAPKMFQEWVNKTEKQHY